MKRLCESGGVKGVKRWRRVVENGRRHGGIVTHYTQIFLILPDVLLAGCHCELLLGCGPVVFVFVGSGHHLSCFR